MSIEIIKPSGGGGSGITSLNGLTASTQFLAVGTSGTDFAISSSVDTNTFNLPTASAINRGALSSADWTTFNGKQDALVSGTNIKTINSTSILGSGNLVVSAGASGVSGAVQFSDGSALSSDATNFFWDNANDRLGLGINAPLGILHLKTAAAATRMVIDGDTSQNKIITYRTNGLQRFGLYTDNTAESGANVGSDFRLRAYSDAGLLLTTPLFIKRSTGNIGINTTILTSAKLNIVGSGSTSATASLKVVNSSNAELLYVGDDGKIGVGTASPLSNMTIAGATLAGDSFVKNFLNVTGTFAATSSAGVQAGIYGSFTTAGSTNFQSVGIYTNLAAGYTGIGPTNCIVGDNACAGTGTNLQLTNGATAPSGNNGFVGYARGTTVGNNIGGFAEASNGLLNIGIFGKSTVNKNSGVNIGVTGFAANGGTSPIQIGGYFGLQTATPTFASAALMCDNGLTSSDIFVARDNGTAIFSIKDNGAISINATNTPLGTTGNQTINKTSGTVNIAAAGTTVTVTNSLVNTNSIIFAMCRTNDTTAYVKCVVPSLGSFAITLGAAATGEVSIGFMVINQ